jgi:hypothetical protein
MNEIILNHIKGYYHGVKDLKCRVLGGELANKINTFKQRIKKSKQHHSKINYLDQNTTDDESEKDEKTLLKLKRKRNNDDEKENHRKVIIKNEQRTVVIKKSNEINKFDHEYCDIMYDNEYEGLHLFHFSPYDIELSEEINPIEHIPEVDIKSTLDKVPLSVVNNDPAPLPTSNNELSKSLLYILYF